MLNYFSFLHVKKLSDIHDRTLMKCTVLINKSFPKYFLLPAFSPGREWKAFRKKMEVSYLKSLIPFANALVAQKLCVSAFGANDR